MSLSQKTSNTGLHNLMAVWGLGDKIVQFVEGRPNEITLRSRCGFHLWVAIVEVSSSSLGTPRGHFFMTCSYKNDYFK